MINSSLAEGKYSGLGRAKKKSRMESEAVRQQRMLFSSFYCDFDSCLCFCYLARDPVTV
jgi:hypothetical protein